MIENQYEFYIWLSELAILKQDYETFQKEERLLEIMRENEEKELLLQLNQENEYNIH